MHADKPHHVGHGLTEVVNELASPGQPVYAIVGTETTGLSAKCDRIIELGVATVDGQFRECERWGSLWNRQGKPHKMAKALVAD